MPIAPCSRYGVHRMVMQGMTAVKDDDTRENINTLGNWYKCDCGERVISEGTPHWDTALLEYVTEGGIIGMFSIGGVAGFWVESDLINYSNNKTIDGYKFYAA
ncbi:hypothetical protein [Ornithinibacillus contaminans]|uniref:hypothetical protein n=1 Tax=Ornithinibacillus contaminans TaxID=694055 RepID=UPI00064DC32D|nr:hypothetical protein [Ornithinibacillus contaminans]